MLKKLKNKIIETVKNFNKIKIICPNCYHANYISKNYLYSLSNFQSKDFNFISKNNSKDLSFKCEKCNSILIIDIKKIKKSILLPMIIIFLIILFILFLITNINLDYDYEYRETPYYVIKEVNKTIPVEKNICENISFRFSTLGGNVVTIGNKVYPNLQITNLENEWGLFKLNFSYINESKFPYRVYGGENLKRAIEEKKISSKDADFYSENYDIMIGPLETILIDKPTQKFDKNTDYWAIGNIIEPKRLICNNKTEFFTIKENKTFTEYKKEKIIIKKNPLNIFYSLFKENIKNFKINIDLLILIILFIFIVYIFYKIELKAKKNNKRIK